MGVGKAHARDCVNPGKSPVHLWKQYQTALPSEDDILSWWRYLSTANVGMALGTYARVDVDGAAGASRLGAISGGDIPATWEFRRGESSRGFLYSLPEGSEYRSHPIPLKGPHQELRFQARGAQTVLPPSRHKGGDLYEWVPGHAPGEIAVAPAPPWVLAQLRTGAPARGCPPGGRAGAGGGGLGDPAAVFLAVVALAHLSPARAESYTNWLHVGQALHAVWGGLLDDWDSWSQGCPSKYEPGACAAKWTTFRADGGLRLRHLIDWAHADSGWTPGGDL
jgi:hypothetical protein